MSDFFVRPDASLALRKPLRDKLGLLERARWECVRGDTYWHATCPTTGRTIWELTLNTMSLEEVRDMAAGG